MKAEVNFLKRAASIGGSVQGFYAFSDGWLFAGNSAMQAGVPFQFPSECAVPAEELEIAVSRMDNPVVALTEGLLVVKAKRLRTTIRCVPYDTVTKYPGDLDKPTNPVPPGFIDAVAKAVPFVSKEGTWQTGVIVTGNEAMAFNNKSAVAITFDGSFPEVILTQPCAEFLAEHKPDRYRTYGNGGLLFLWDDGRWLRVQTLAYPVPQAVVKRIFGNEGTDKPVPITDDFRSALDDAGALGEKIEVRPDRLIARRENSLSEIAIRTPVPAEHVSLWEYKLLALVAPVATEWHPTQHPEAALFKAPGVRGAIMGTRT